MFFRYISAVLYHNPQMPARAQAVKMAYSVLLVVSKEKPEQLLSPMVVRRICSGVNRKSRGESPLWTGKAGTRSICSSSLCGKIPKKHLFRWREISKGVEPTLQGESRGEAPLWAEKTGAESFRSSFLCGGRIQRNRVVSWQGIQWGQRPLGTRSCLQGLVCYTFRGRATGKSGCRLFGRTDFHDA